MHGADGYPDGWWTVERIIDAIQNYAAKYGEPPSADEWSYATLRRKGKTELLERNQADGCWPNAYTVMRNVGSWTKALELAGFEARPIGRKPVETFGELPERCGNGHLWSENTFYKAGRSARYCRQCQRDANIRRYRRQKGYDDPSAAVRPPGHKPRERLGEP